jgi:hypothetical protein
MADNGAALAALDAQVRRLRSVKGLAEEAAPAVAEALVALVHKNIAAGQGPTGEAWQLTEAGGVPLRGAAAAVTGQALGTVVQLRVSGRHAFHHRGQTRGGIARPILPSRASFDAFKAEIGRVLGEHYSKRMRGVDG